MCPTKLISIRCSEQCLALTEDSIKVCCCHPAIDGIATIAAAQACVLSCMVYGIAFRAFNSCTFSIHSHDSQGNLFKT